MLSPCSLLPADSDRQVPGIFLAWHNKESHFIYSAEQTKVFSTARRRRWQVALLRTCLQNEQRGHPFAVSVVQLANADVGSTRALVALAVHGGSFRSEYILSEVPWPGITKIGSMRLPPCWSRALFLAFRNGTPFQARLTFLWGHHFLQLFGCLVCPKRCQFNHHRTDSNAASLHRACKKGCVPEQLMLAQ